MTLGGGAFRYELVDRWAQFPPEWNVRDVSGVAVDSRDFVYAFSRCEYPVCVFSPEGKLVARWGAGLFTHPHGIFVDVDDSVYCVGDRGHCLRKFTSDGKLLFTLEPDDPDATNGYVWNDPATIRHSLPPFHFPLTPQSPHRRDLRL